MMTEATPPTEGRPALDGPTEETAVTTTAPPKDDAKLAKKRDEEKARQERIKTAKKRLVALPKNEQTKVQGAAARAEQDGKAAGKRQASVAYLEQALDTHAAPKLTVVPEPAPPKKAKRPAGPRERSVPKETPGQLAPETKTAPRPRTGPAAIQATVSVTVPATHKTCTRCHNDKPLADFLTKAGTGKPRPTCRPCYNEAWREFDANRKKAKAAATSE